MVYWKTELPIETPIGEKQRGCIWRRSILYGRGARLFLGWRVFLCPCLLSVWPYWLGWPLSGP